MIARTAKVVTTLSTERNAALTADAKARAELRWSLFWRLLIGGSLTAVFVVPFAAFDDDSRGVTRDEVKLYAAPDQLPKWTREDVPHFQCDPSAQYFGYPMRLRMCRPPPCEDAYLVALSAKRPFHVFERGGPFGLEAALDAREMGWLSARWKTVAQVPLDNGEVTFVPPLTGWYRLRFIGEETPASIQWCGANSDGAKSLERMQRIELDGNTLSLNAIADVAAGRAEVKLFSCCRPKVDEARALVEKIAAATLRPTASTPASARSPRCASTRRTARAAAQPRALARRGRRRRRCRAEARALMLLRCNVLATGYTGIRPRDAASWRSTCSTAACSRWCPSAAASAPPATSPRSRTSRWSSSARARPFFEGERMPAAAGAGARPASSRSCSRPRRA